MGVLTKSVFAGVIMRWLIVILLLPSLLSCGSGKVNNSQTNMKKGKVLTARGVAVWGARACLGTNCESTQENGTFQIESKATGEMTITITANGYETLAKSVLLSAGDADLGTFTISSLNTSDLQASQHPDSYGTMKSAIVSAGFPVLNDDATHLGLADAHVNGLLNTRAFNRRETVGKVADEMNRLGMRLGNSAMTRANLVNLLQQTLKAAYTAKDDPRFYDILYVFSNDNGTLPDSVPSISDTTGLSAEKSAILYSTLTFILTHPLTDGAKAKLEHALATRLQIVKSELPGTAASPLDFWDGILDGLKEFGQTVADYFVGAFAEFTRYAGRMLGMYVATFLAGGLQYLTGGLSAPLSGYIIQAGTYYGEQLGNYVADYIVREYEDNVGRKVYSPGKQNDSFLKKDGTPGYTSDILVAVTWTGGQLTTDLSLYVTDPHGETVSTLNPVSDVGTYEVDGIGNGGPDIYKVARGKAIPGSYRIEVEYEDGVGSVMGTVTVYFKQGLPDEVKRTFGPTAFDPPGSRTVVGTVQWPPAP